MNLTAKQEKFSQNIASGMIQYQSYLDAYPNSKNYQRSTVDERASILMRNSKIKARIEELKAPQQDYLESKRKELIEKAIAISLKDEKVKSTSVAMLRKLLDKLLPTVTEQKIEHSGDVTFIIEGMDKV